MQQSLYLKFKNHKIFKDNDLNGAPSNNRNLLKNVSKTYKKICKLKEGQGEKDADKGVSEKKIMPHTIEKIQNLKVTRKTLIAYLRKRYSARVATKMACIFDWSNTQESYEPFYQRITDVLLKPKDLNMMSASYQNDHYRLLKKFAFQVLDMNCDRMICEADLFTFLELHKDDNQFFKTTLIYDIQDISKALNQRNQTLLTNDQVMDHTNPDAPQIKNLNNYIEMFKKKRKMIEDSLHYSERYVTGDQQASQKGGNSSSVDSGNMIASFGQAYERTFKKMMGQSGKEKSSKSVLGTRKDNTNNDVSKQRQNVTEASLREMHSQGTLQYVAEHKKKPGLSYFINKTDDKFGSKPSAD